MTRPVVIVRDDWLAPVFLGAIGFAVSAVAVVRSLHPGIVAALAGLTALLWSTRQAFRTDPARGIAFVGLQVFGLVVLRQRSVPLASVRQVSVSCVVERVRTEHGTREETSYPVVVIGERELALWSPRRSMAARAQGESLSRALRIPLRDRLLRAERVRGWEELDLTLGQRLRARGEQPGSCALPPGSRIQVRTGPETEIAFPAQPTPAWALIPVPVVAAVGVGVWFGLGWLKAAPFLAFMAYWEAMWLRFYVGCHRPTSLRVDREAVVVTGPFGGKSRIALERLEEVAEDGTSLWLISDSQQERIPYHFNEAAERAFVLGVVQRASCEHPSANARTPSPRAELAP